MGYYNEFGKKDYKPKDRSNHIHHCIDAITIAFINKNKYDTLAHAWSLEDKGELNNAKKELEKSKPWKRFTQDVKTIIDEVLIVHNTPDNVKKQSKKVLRKRGKKQYVIEYEKDSRGKRMPKRDKSGKIIYKPDKEGNKIPIIQQGDTVRGSLHQDTFYGAIKQPELEDGKMQFYENGRIILKQDKKTGKEEIKYVVRRILSNLGDKDIKNIVDERIKMIVEQGRKKEKELKKEIEKLSKDLIQAENFEKPEIKKQITTLKNKIEKKLYVIPPKKGKTVYTPIRKVRCIANDVKNPLKIKKQRMKSKKEYKQHFNVKNEENYCMAIYEIKDENGKIKRICKLVNMLEAGQYYKLSNKKYRKLYPIVPEKNIENEYSLKYILIKGLMVLLYEKCPENIWEMSDKERLTRLYEITQLDTEQSCIKLLYHQEAREKKEITKYMGLKSGMKGGKNIGKFKEFPWIKIGPNAFDALVEGFDFNITPTGKIIKI
jgi:CRISPR-associated endonuclease Csn1